MSIIKIKKEERYSYDIVMMYFFFFFVNDKNISGMLVL